MANRAAGIIRPAVEIDFTRIVPEDVKILIVDDSRFARRLIRNALSMFQFANTVEAADADEATETLNSNKIDLVLVEFEMPGLNGAEFVHSVRWDESGDMNPEVPIIMISQHTAADVILKARNSGIHEFLAKPVSPKNLYLRIMFTLNNPRPFIRAGNYRGPDRRWLKDGGSPDGLERLHVPEMIDCR